MPTGKWWRKNMFISGITIFWCLKKDRSSWTNEQWAFTSATTMLGVCEPIGSKCPLECGQLGRDGPMRSQRPCLTPEQENTGNRMRSRHSLGLLHECHAGLGDTLRPHPICQCWWWAVFSLCFTFPTQLIKRAASGNTPTPLNIPALTSLDGGGMANPISQV